MIEINETQPTEASLTLVLRGDDVECFKSLIAKASPARNAEGRLACKIWEAINS